MKLKDGTEYSEKEVVEYNMGGILAKTIKPRTISLPKRLKRRLIYFLNEAEKRYKTSYNRVRFDLVKSNSGEFHMYEINTGNPLGNLTTAEIFRLHEHHQEADAIEERIMNSFGDRIPVIAIHENNAFFNTEVAAFEELFKKLNKKYFIENWREIDKYLGNKKYVIWYTGGLDVEEKYQRKLFEANNLFGGKFGGIGLKGELTKKNFPNNNLIIPNTELIALDNGEEWMVPPGKVAKIFKGPKNFGGRGVFKEGGIIVQDKNSKEVIIQDLIESKFELDLNILNKKYFIGFQRIPIEGQFLANISQGGAVYVPSILKWI